MTYKKLKATAMLLMLTALFTTSCDDIDNPVLTSLDIDMSDLVLTVGESATRAATTKSDDYQFFYSSSNPSVATVNQNGKVTALSVGEAIIKVYMPETRIGWYAEATREYKVFVKQASTADLKKADKATPLTLVAQADGKITITFNGGIMLANDIHYTINDGEEQTIDKHTSGAFHIQVKQGDVVSVYSVNSSLGGGSAVAATRARTRAVDDGAKYINIRPSMKTEIYGNVMSLLKGKDNLESATTIEANNAFYGLFAGAEKLVNNTERLLVLPATTLTEGCYDNMFSGCKGIEKAPELPAPKLEKNCYQEMFYDCAKLNQVKCLATDIKAENSTKDWLGKAGTEATGEKVLETLVPMTPNSDDGVPDGWKAIIVVTGIKLDKTELTLTIGDAAVQLKATVSPDNATDKTVIWSSDKPEVATVDATGKVTAVAAGEATITAQIGEKTATCQVTVNKKAGSISYAATSIEKQPTDPAFTNALTKTGDGKVSYSSDKESVAKVNATTGEVTIVGDGEATITATVADSDTYTYATKTATYTVIVKSPTGINPLDPFENGGDPFGGNHN